MIALTIGFFDGVHLGHQLILNRLKETGCKTVVLTFDNHPAEILGRKTPPLLTSSSLKIPLLKEQGIDEIISIPFTRPLADLSYEEFLAPFPLSHLILGEDAAIGKGRLGNPDALRLLGLAKKFTVQSIQKAAFDNQPISSTRIRTLIAQGKLTEAEKLLGRPYCFYYTPETAQIALPPDGEYAVRAYSPAGNISTTLSIRNQVPELPLEAPQLVSFGPKPLNPQLFDQICQLSPAAS